LQGPFSLWGEVKQEGPVARPNRLGFGNTLSNMIQFSISQIIVYKREGS
jgi:hypothetical protein